jgi:hypothetical protein
VLVTDSVANGYADYVLDSSQGVTAGRIGPSAITSLAVALLVTAPGYGLGSTPPAAPSSAILIRSIRSHRRSCFLPDPAHAVPQMCHTSPSQGWFMEARGGSQASELRKHQWGRSDLNRRPTDYEVIVWVAGGR